MEACSLLVNLRKGMQSSSEQPLVGEERYVTTRITAAKETNQHVTSLDYLIHEFGHGFPLILFHNTIIPYFCSIIYVCL